MYSQILLVFSVTPLAAGPTKAGTAARHGSALDHLKTCSCPQTILPSRLPIILGVSTGSLHSWCTDHPWYSHWLLRIQKEGQWVPTHQLAGRVTDVPLISFRVYHLSGTLPSLKQWTKPKGDYGHNLASLRNSPLGLSNLSILILS